MRLWFFCHFRSRKSRGFPNEQSRQPTSFSSASSPGLSTRPRALAGENRSRLCCTNSRHLRLRPLCDAGTRVRPYPPQFRDHRPSRAREPSLLSHPTTARQAAPSNFAAARPVITKPEIPPASWFAFTTHNRPSQLGPIPAPCDLGHLAAKSALPKMSYQSDELSKGSAKDLEVSWISQPKRHSRRSSHRNTRIKNPPKTGIAAASNLAVY